MDVEPLADKWRAFNWNVTVLDGHDFGALLAAFKKAREEDIKTGRPHLILANTIKGKGVSFMEDKIAWHGAAPNKEESAKALEEIRSKLV
jgi:transketolase